MREHVGIIDLTPFTKHEVTGPGARSLARRPGGQQGAGQGRAHGAVACAHPPRRHPLRIHHHQDRRAALLRRERRSRRALRQRLPAQGAARGRLGRLRNITNTRGCFVLAGPKSREVLAQLTDTPLDNASFPWLTAQTIEAGLAVDVYALRVNFVGALGWELHFPIEYAHHLFDALFEARQGARHRHGGHARHGVAAHGEVLPHVGQRHDARLHALRGQPRSLRAHEQGRRSSAARRSRSSWPRVSPTASSRSRCTA